MASAATNVLVSGAGVAGPTLAWWLRRHGFEVTIVEHAQRFRTGGYIIDFWGAGFDVAGRMGLLPEICRKGYAMREVRVVDAQGKRISGFPAEPIVRLSGGRYTSVARGDLAATIYKSIGGSVETIFGDSIESIEQTPEVVEVAFARGKPRRFDLVVGADGVHSNVRRLVFGADDRFEHYLGFKVAAFSVDGYSARDELVYVMYTEVGQQVSRFTMRDDRTMFLFTFADPDMDMPRTVEEQKTLLRERFGRSGWECPQILEALERSPDLYFDRVSQIRMPADQWCAGGRVALIGDAASCASLLAGEGAGLGMIAAYTLAGELHRAGGDYASAIRRYRDRFLPFVTDKQKAALRFAKTFAPPSKFAMQLRNAIFRLMSVGWIARIAGGRGLIDDIVLPDY